MTATRESEQTSEKGGKEGVKEGGGGGGRERGEGQTVGHFVCIPGRLQDQG